MLKKRVIFLFFAFFSISLFSQNISIDKIVENIFKNSPDTLFLQGIISNNDTVNNFYLYRVKNRDNFFDLSLLLNNDVFKISSKTNSEITYKNNENISDNNLFLKDLPLDLLNYGLRNREYQLLSEIKYKGIEVYKVIIIDKVVPIIIDKIEDLVSDQVDSEPLESENEIIENNSSIDKDFTNDIEINNKFKKIILYISKETGVIIKEEFYSQKTDREPLFIKDVKNINYINGFYIPVFWEINSLKSKQTYLVKYNNETISYNKTDIPNNMENMTNFYGVK